MATLIKSSAGSVFVENIQGPQYMAVSGLELFSDALILLSAVKINRRESLQHIKTMTSKVYSYAFGELPGQVQVGGTIIFVNSCNGQGGDLEMVNRFYDDKRAYNGLATYISIGGAGFRVALTALDFGADAGPFPHGKFTLGFSVLPRNETQQ